MNKEAIENEQEVKQENAIVKKKKKYHEPILTELGSMQLYTLGGSAGFGDSGGGAEVPFGGSF